MTDTACTMYFECVTTNYTDHIIPSLMTRHNISAAHPGAIYTENWAELGMYDVKGAEFMFGIQEQFTETFTTVSTNGLFTFHKGYNPSSYCG